MLHIIRWSKQRLSIEQIIFLNLACTFSFLNLPFYISRFYPPSLCLIVWFISVFLPFYLPFSLCSFLSLSIFFFPGRLLLSLFLSSFSDNLTFNHNIENWTTCRANPCKETTGSTWPTYTPQYPLYPPPPQTATTTLNLKSLWHP